MAKTADAPQATEAKRNSIEAAIAGNPTSPSPFLKELDSITGPAQTRVLGQLDRDGYGGRAQGLEAQKIMSEIHSVKSTFGYGEITKADIQSYGVKSQSAAEKALAKRLADHFVEISHDGNVISQADITKYLGQEQNKADMRNLHAKRRDGSSLFGDVKTADGGIDGDKLDKKLADPTLTPQDKASLDRLNQARPEGWTVDHTGDLTADQVRRMDRDAELKPQDIAGLRKQAQPQSAESQRAEAALADLTARPGGRPSLLERLSDGNGGVSGTKVIAMLNHPEQNNLSGKNLETLKYLQENLNVRPDKKGGMQLGLNQADLQQLGATVGDKYWDKVSGRPATTRLDAATLDRNRDFAHLFEKPSHGTSLYDKLKSPDGSIAIDKLDAAIKDPSMRGADKHTLEYVRDLARNGNVWGKYDLTQADLLAKAHDHGVANGTLTRGGFDVRAAEQADTAATTPVAQRDFTPAMQDALRVRSGEGYAHSAQRLLAEAHKGEHHQVTQKELKDLIAQLRKDNPNELKRGDVLKLNQDYVDHLFGR